jgi:effector-binding domain-containing protein
MSKLKSLSLLLLTIGLMVVSAADIFAKVRSNLPAFALRKVDEKVVLYTIYRGGYDKAGIAVGKLFALAGEKRIIPRGRVSYAYLNNPRLVSSEHWLTEIRIPVGKEALNLAGTLGEMTDVKTLLAMQMAVAVKPEGQADPGPIYESLHSWIVEKGYCVIDSHSEVFLTNAMTGNYARMKTEIMVPIKKHAEHKD